MAGALLIDWKDGGQGRNRTADASLFRAGLVHCHLLQSQRFELVFRSYSRRLLEPTGTTARNHTGSSVHCTISRQFRETRDSALLRLRNELLINIERRTCP